MNNNIIITEPIQQLDPSWGDLVLVKAWGRTHFGLVLWVNYTDGSSQEISDLAVLVHDTCVVARPEDVQVMPTNISGCTDAASFFPLTMAFLKLNAPVIHAMLGKREPGERIEAGNFLPMDRPNPLEEERETSDLERRVAEEIIESAFRAGREINEMIDEADPDDSGNDEGLDNLKLLARELWAEMTVEQQQRYISKRVNE